MWINIYRVNLIDREREREGWNNWHPSKEKKVLLPIFELYDYN